MMTFKKKLLAGSLATMLLIAAILWTMMDSGTTVSVTEAPGAAWVATTKPIATAESGSASERKPLQTGAVVITVMDMVGNPLAHAEPLRWSPVTGRLEELEASRFLDTTMKRSLKDGQIRLSEDILMDPAFPHPRLHIQLPGYRIAEVQLAPHQKTYSVRLTRGQRLRIRAQLLDGTPLAGMRFRLQSSGIGLPFEEASQKPGVYYDPRNKVTEQFIGETGQEGWLELSNLGNRLYLIQSVFSDGPYIPARKQGFLVAKPPFQDLIYRFEVPLALIESVKDDEVQGGMTEDMSRWWLKFNLAHRWCLTKMRALQKKYPGAYVSIRLPKKGAKVPDYVDLSLRTEQHGWVDVEGQYRPLTDFTKPHENVVRRTRAPATFELVLKDPDGRNIKNASGFRLTRQMATSSAGDIWLMSSHAVKVPPGKYLVRSSGYWKGAKIMEPLQIRSGEEIHHIVKIEERLVPHEFQILAPDGTLSVFGTILFRTEGDLGPSGIISYGPGVNVQRTIHLWLPEKVKFQYWVTSFGFPVLEGSLITHGLGMEAKDRIVKIQLHK